MGFIRRRTGILLAVAATLLALPLTAAFANHAWANYHWERTTTDPVTVRLGDNVSGAWDTALNGASSDWTSPPAGVATNIETSVVAGAGLSSCGPVAGKVEVCNGAYGENGWLGLASIWISRGRSSHITAGMVQVNDTYFSQNPYNSSVWRQLVMCQEIGHTLGLDHQDENFYNEPLGTCMDYTANPTDADAHPNYHDYEELAIIYDHIDGSKTGGGPKNKPGGRGPEFVPNTALPVNAQPADGDVFSRVLPSGELVITFVTWLHD